MQTVSNQFATYANGRVRPIDYKVLISFDKAFDDNVDFFTIGSSSIGGSDIIKGQGEVVQEWDKYAYEDFSSRVISFEWTRQQDNPYSANLGFADVTLDNHDDYFTPENDSPIDDYILPGRPIRIYAGFGNESIPVLIGITEKLPEVDQRSKTAKFHCVDFLQTLYNRPLDEEVIYQDMRVDEILGALFESVGLTSTQYDFDEAFTVVPFAFFEKGTKLGDAAQKLVQADLGYLFMDENGMISYRNRQNFSDVPVKEYNDENVVNRSVVSEDEIVNVVEVKSNIREVQESQKVWELTESTVVPAGETVEVWADFQDPVTSADDPVYTASPQDISSEFTGNTASDGSGSAYSNWTVTTTLFSTSMKMEFENTGGSSAYLTLIRLWGTPAKVTSQLYVREQVDVSVAQFEEQILTIENDYIQDESTATSLALVTLGIYSDLGGVDELDVIGNPALQLRDAVDVYGNTHNVKKQVNVIDRSGGGMNYRQSLTVERRIVLDYFTIGVSSIGSAAVIAP